jgi:hypothetical protein
MKGWCGVCANVHGASPKARPPTKLHGRAHPEARATLKKVREASRHDTSRLTL